MMTHSEYTKAVKSAKRIFVVVKLNEKRNAMVKVSKAAALKMTRENENEMLASIEDGFMYIGQIRKN